MGDLRLLQAERLEPSQPWEEDLVDLLDQFAGQEAQPDQKEAVASGDAWVNWVDVAFGDGARAMHRYTRQVPR